MRLYLAHPFDTRHEVRAVELQIERDIGVELLNPFYDTDRTDVVSIDAGRNERYERLNPVQIVERDLELIRNGDGVVAYVPGNCFSVGTVCEMWYSSTHDKPVYVVSADHGRHPWIQYMVFVSDGEIFQSWDEFKIWLKGRNEDAVHTG